MDMFYIVFWILWIINSCQAQYTEYLNENYTIYYSFSEISWDTGNSYCELASITSESSTTSVKELIQNAELTSYDHWIGLHASDCVKLNNDFTWIDGSAYSYENWGSNEPGNGFSCCVSIDNTAQWFGRTCTDNRIVTAFECNTFICNTELARTYSISITLSGSTTSFTNENIWFRIKGEILMTNNDNDTWTEWFSHDEFYYNNYTYQWDETLKNVGSPDQIIILSQQNDDLILHTISVDGIEYTPNNDIQLVYYDGPHGDGCSYIIVHLSENTYEDYTTITEECPYHNVLPTTEPTTTTTNPTSVQSPHPSAVTNHPSPIPSPQPSTSPTNNPTLTTFAPTSTTHSPTPITNAPTSNTPSPTSQTFSPTVNTKSPTIQTQHPTTITSPPTATTTAPTQETSYPTSYPTPKSNAPTHQTKSPTKITNAPTSNTLSPTINTFAPTVETSSPTIQTLPPTIISSPPTPATKSPTPKTKSPTSSPTSKPSGSPTNIPTNKPTISPTLIPSNPPTNITPAPTNEPSIFPSNEPTYAESVDSDEIDNTSDSETDESGNDGSDIDGNESNDLVSDDSNNDNNGNSSLDSSLYVLIGILIFLIICCVVAFRLWQQYLKHQALASFKKARKSDVSSTTSKSAPHLQKEANLADIVASVKPNVNVECNNNNYNNNYNNTNNHNNTIITGLGGLNPDDIEWSTSSSDENGDGGEDQEEEEDGVINIITTSNKNLQVYKTSMGPIDDDLDRIVYNETEVNNNENTTLKENELDDDDDDDIILGMNNTVGDGNGYGNHNNNQFDQNMVEYQNNLDEKDNSLINIDVNAVERVNNNDTNIVDENEIRGASDAKFGARLDYINKADDLLMDEDEHDDDDDVLIGITPGGNV